MLIHGFVLLGVAVVLPLALGGPTRRWIAVAALVAVSFVPASGALAAVFVVPFVVVALVAAGTTWIRTASKRMPGDAGTAIEHGGSVIAATYAVVAAVALFQSRAGLSLHGIGEPIIELTAVHFMYAGAASATLAVVALRRCPPRWARLGTVGVVLTACAPPVVAVGFVWRLAWFQVVGAVLMTVGVWATGVLHLVASADPGRAGHSRALLIVSGLGPWIPMVLAVSWAAGQHWSVPALSIPDMARVHGSINGVVFVVCGLVGRRLEPGAFEPAVPARVIR